MNCGEVQEYLLEWGPAPAEGLSAEVAEHLKACGSCERLADQLRKIEQATLDLPASGASRAKERFLRRLEGVHQQAAFRRVGTWSKALRWPYAAAAMVLLALGAGLWVLLESHSDLQAATVTERLMDWNLDLVNAPSIEHRKGIYAAQAQELESAVAGTPVDSDEGQLARALYKNGQWLRDHNDPLAEAEAFSDVADLLVPKMESLTKSDRKALKRTGKLLAQVEQMGILVSIEKAELAGNLVGERDRKLQKVLDRNLKRQARLEALLVQVAEPDRPAVRNALEASKHGHAKAKKRATQPSSRPVLNSADPTGVL